MLASPARAAPDVTGTRLGPFWLTPGVTRGNARTLLFGAFSTLSLVTFVTFAQPYLFSILGIPQDRQGGLAGLLVALQEGLQVLIAGFIGAWSDRVGRRVVYVTGLALMCASFVLYPLAGSEADLIAYRIFYALGMTAATVMMSTCFAEYTQDVTRGRWMGLVGVFNGLGVVLMAMVLAKLPLLFARLGFDDVASIRYSFWVFAIYILFLAVVLRTGLQGHGARPESRKITLLRQSARGIAAARDNPRIALAYLTAFASRGDLVIITTFISLWVIQAGIDAGMSLGAATAKAGMIFGLAQGVALVWSLAMGMLLDRMNRLTGVCLAFGLAALGYSALGQVDDPFGPWMIPAAVLAGIGESSAVVAAGVLIGQEAPAPIRGALIGTFGLAGSLGIVCLTYAGGQVFDNFGRSAPFALMGAVNFIVLVVALVVRHRALAESARALRSTVTITVAARDSGPT